MLLLDMDKGSKIRQLISELNKATVGFRSPKSIMDHDIANDIYGYGMDILGPLYDCIDDYPITCIVLAGGLVKLGVIYNFFKEENRGNIGNMMQEYKDFFTEYQIISLLRKIEKESYGNCFIISRLKHKDAKEILNHGLKCLIPIYKAIDTCPNVCCMLLGELMSKRIMQSIFTKEEWGNIEIMTAKFKAHYVDNRVKFLIEKIEHLERGVVVYDFEHKRRIKQTVVDELAVLGPAALKIIYNVIDEHKLACVNIIPSLIKPSPFKHGYAVPNKLAAEYKEWYKEKFEKYANSI